VVLKLAQIPMPDGIHLAANLFFPDGARPDERFPVLLEYLPYRKDDWSAQRDYELHSYFVRRGFVSARVDIRGTGASQGRQPDREYSDQELEDGMAVIDWVSRQPWSNGKVGMMGISWGGFNSIQMAMRHPPALKAILAVDASDDLFHDDIHYIDGMMHADEFELSMDLTNALSPAPDFPIDEATLAARFDTQPWFLIYLQHQRDSAFWRRASLRPDYSRINIPVFLIGGFLDGYRDSIPRMMAGVRAPVKAIVGPWNHTFPHEAEPGPEIEWREKAVRWWDQWLKGRDTGILREPRLDVYLRHAYPAGLALTEVPGEWRSEAAWPPLGQRDATYYLTPSHALSSEAPAKGAHALRCIPSTGIEAGFWWGDLTADQRPADTQSLVYDSEPLREEVTVLGLPQAILSATATSSLANWFVRLEDVAPDGAVTLVTGGGLAGAQRDSSTDPRPLQPAHVYDFHVPLHFTSWLFPPGHRIRVAISNALWPMIWPTPYPLSTTLHLGESGGSRILLPLVPRNAPAQPLFAKPEPSPPFPGYSSAGETWPGNYHLERDAARGTTHITWAGKYRMTFPWGSEESHEEMIYDLEDAMPSDNSVRGEADFVVRVRDTVLTWRVHLLLRSDAHHFYYQFERELLKDGFQLRDRVWKATIIRDFQ
jgi:putative CocE/NonD family hydrolase